MAIRILMADDHTLFRHGLRRILQECPGFEVVAEAVSGLEAVELSRLHQPDVAIVDIGMKELNGIEATSAILKLSPRTAVLILSMHSDGRYVVRSIKAGARGYLSKDSVEESLILAIQQLHSGQPYFCHEATNLLEGQSHQDLQQDHVDEQFERLTERERQLYQLLAEGRSNKEIANRLGLSLHTVETHRSRIMEKLELHGIAELVLSAVRRGLIQ